ncbi:MAG: hypothetical protein WBQ94_30445 [Terracidiphilus sp.]
MKYEKAADRESAGNGRGRGSIWHGAAVLLGALFLAWPAFYNGFPLLYPDSMTYLDDGRTVARAIFLHQFSAYYGMRSFFYSLGILPFHWNISPWPVVGLQCVLVAWALWLVMRSLDPRHTVTRYLTVVLLLSTLTGVSWYSAFIMPDILGPLAYLLIYLLVFFRKTLTRVEQWALFALAVWGITAHSSHLLLAGGLWLLLVVFAAFERRLFFSRLKALGVVAGILAVAIAAQMALNGYLYGKPSLNGERPPYLMARIIADGPGRTYLQQHCSQVKWAVCNHLSQLTEDADNFLWGPDGGYASASDDDRELMGKQEMPFVVAAIRAYPRDELSKAEDNFWNQLMAFGIYGFDPSPWLLDQFNMALPSARASYVDSRQARDLLPLDLTTSIQSAAVSVSLGVIAASIPFLWRRPSPQLAGLTVVVLSIVVANAFVTGVLSTVDDRYGCRVIWLIPLLAAAFLLDWLNQWETAKGSGAGAKRRKPAGRKSA